MTNNKLNGLSLNQALLLKRALFVLSHHTMSEEDIDDNQYLTQQLNSIIEYLERI